MITISCYEWEDAEITLPTIAVTPLKKALRGFTNNLHAAVREQAIKVHKDIGTRSPDKYRAKLRTLEQAEWERRDPENRWGTRPTVPPSMVRSMALSVLQAMLETTGRESKAPRQPTVADVEVFAPRATNKTNAFQVISENGFSEAYITFTGSRTVRWNVPENNHAREHAHAAPMAGVFFDFLNKITWTRGTGGEGVGNDEYSRDSYEAGGGANYETFRYGPERAKQRVARW